MILPQLIIASITQMGHFGAAEISSDQIEYTNNTLHLEGSVDVKHDIGKLLAQRADLHTHPEDKEQPFHAIELNCSVQIEAKDGTKFSAEHAHLDFLARMGRATSENRLQMQHHDQFSLSCHELEFSWEESDKTPFSLLNITAKKDVRCDWGDDRQLHADHLSLSKESQAIHATSETRPCYLTFEGGEIQAREIESNTLFSQLSCKEASGRIVADPKPMEFSCDSLSFLLERFLLESHVIIEDPALGRLKAEEVLLSRQGALKAQGNIELEHEGGKLTSSGELIADRKQDLISITTEKNGPHLQLSTAFATILARRAFATISSRSVIFEQDVQMAFKENEIERYRASSDRVEYLPETQTLLLQSLPENSVSLWDEVEKKRLTAVEISLQRDAQTGELTISGKGAVKIEIEGNGYIHDAYFRRKES